MKQNKSVFQMLFNADTNNGEDRYVDEAEG